MSTSSRVRPWRAKEYAAFMGMTEAAASQERFRGDGPKFIKVNRSVYYDPEDVYAFLDANKIQRTDERAGIAS